MQDSGFAAAASVVLGESDRFWGHGDYQGGRDAYATGPDVGREQYDDPSGGGRNRVRHQLHTEPRQGIAARIGIGDAGLLFSQSYRLLYTG